MCSCESWNAFTHGRSLSYLTVERADLAEMVN